MASSCFCPLSYLCQIAPQRREDAIAKKRDTLGRFRTQIHTGPEGAPDEAIREECWQ